MNKILIGVLAISFMTTSCVSRKKYNKQSALYETLKKDCGVIESNLQKCLDESGRNAAENARLNQELADLKANSTTMLQQLSNMSVINSTQSESIRKSLENINSKDSYIKDLQTAMAHKDSLNMALVLNLKGALKDVNDEDVTINVEGSAVFISISDKMLFSSGSYNITPRAKTVLGKVAEVIKAQPDVQFMVEGHTDNKAISTASIKDNWDLSVMRATSVVRVLQKNYGVDPSRMIAAGRSEYVPVTSNGDTNGRSLNRRTRIVILPQLDQFFKMLEPK
ncbi:MAG: OmpA family protein [Bacteroidetes bacterium]|nr:OmpA family protein [Bacteroidota bacterium]